MRNRSENSRHLVWRTRLGNSMLVLFVGHICWSTFASAVYPHLKIIKRIVCICVCVCVWTAYTFMRQSQHLYPDAYMHGFVSFNFRSLRFSLHNQLHHHSFPRSPFSGDLHCTVCSAHTHTHTLSSCGMLAARSPPVQLSVSRFRLVQTHLQHLLPFELSFKTQLLTNKKVFWPNLPEVLRFWVCVCGAHASIFF